MIVVTMIVVTMIVVTMIVVTMIVVTMIVVTLIVVTLIGRQSTPLQPAAAVFLLAGLGRKRIMFRCAPIAARRPRSAGGNSCTISGLCAFCSVTTAQPLAAGFLGLRTLLCEHLWLGRGQDANQLKNLHPKCIKTK